MMFDIRPAAPHDAKTVAALMRAAWPDDDVDVPRVKQILAGGQHSTLIAWVGQAPAAFVDAFLTISAEGVRRWELDLLATAPEFRGRGAAGVLVSACEAAGRASGAALVRALTREDNIPVHRVFARADYHTDGILRVLAVADALAGETPPAADAAIIPVQTLTYGGGWVEGNITPERLQAARQGLTAGEISGVLVPVEREIIPTLESNGYSVLGVYSWWIKSL